VLDRVGRERHSELHQHRVQPLPPIARRHGLRSALDGRWRVRLRHPGTGRAVTVWADAGVYPWVQVFTGDSLPEPLRRTSGVAVEPMTCPPDAFRSGRDLVVLAPGQEFEGDWGISPS